MRLKRLGRWLRWADLPTSAVFCSAVYAAAAGPAFAAGSAAGEASMSLAQASSTQPSSEPRTITITGGSEDAPAAETVSLDGTYVVAAGGSRSAAVLGAVSFDPAGTVTGGTLSFITPSTGDGEGGDEDGDSESAPTTTRTSTTASTASLTIAATGSSADLGADATAAPAAAPADSAVVTDCSVGGGSYTLGETGAGAAQIQLSCSDGSPTVTWRLFVTATDGFTLARQFRAVQLEPLSESDTDGIIDLLLTLR